MNINGHKPPYFSKDLILQKCMDIKSTKIKNHLKNNRYNWQCKHFHSKTDIQSQSLEIDAGLPIINEAVMQDYQNRLI